MTFDKAYRNLLAEILVDGEEMISRNGNTIQIPSYSFTLQDMANNCKLTMRKMFYKGVIGEFKTITDPTPLTNVKQFEANGCNYWEKWAGPKGELTLDYHDLLHPQLDDIVDNINKDPYSRRHVVAYGIKKITRTVP